MSTESRSLTPDHRSASVVSSDKARSLLCRYKVVQSGHGAVKLQGTLCASVLSAVSQTDLLFPKLSTNLAIMFTKIKSLRYKLANPSTAVLFIYPWLLPSPTPHPLPAYQIMGHTTLTVKYISHQHTAGSVF